MCPFFSPSSFIYLQTLAISWNQYECASRHTSLHQWYFQRARLRSSEVLIWSCEPIWFVYEMLKWLRTATWWDSFSGTWWVAKHVLYCDMKCWLCSKHAWLGFGLFFINNLTYIFWLIFTSLILWSMGWLNGTVLRGLSTKFLCMFLFFLSVDLIQYTHSILLRIVVKKISGKLIN